MYFCVVCIVCFVSFSVLFVCICVLNYCHRAATQFQLNIPYHIETTNQFCAALRGCVCVCILALTLNLLAPTTVGARINP